MSKHRLVCAREFNEDTPDELIAKHLNDHELKDILITVCWNKLVEYVEE